jgi:Sortase domain
VVAAVAAVLLAVAGLAVLWAGLRGPDGPPVPPGAAAGARSAPSSPPSVTGRGATPGPAPTGRTGSGRTAAGHDAGVADLLTGPVLPASRPVRVEIPRLRVSSSLEDLGIDRAGAMEVPRDPARAGWFDRGPAPGSLGPAVIAGHVTWNRAPAVFFRLGALRRGDAVRVRRADGTTAVFSVTRLARYGKSTFPTRVVYGPIDHAGLRLITCGGRYDASRHRYLSNVVAFADLVAARRTPG